MKTNLKLSHCLLFEQTLQRLSSSRLHHTRSKWGKRRHRFLPCECHRLPMAFYHHEIYPACLNLYGNTLDPENTLIPLSVNVNNLKVNLDAKPCPDPKTVAKRPEYKHIYDIQTGPPIHHPPPPPSPPVQTSSCSSASNSNAPRDPPPTPPYPTHPDPWAQQSESPTPPPTLHT